MNRTSHTRGMVDHNAPGMGKLLKLSGELEAHFWSREETAGLFQLLDSLGLALRIIINVKITLSNMPQSYRYFSAASAVIMALQVLWCLLHKRSYVSWRIPVMAVHRLRWFLLSFWMCTRSSNPWESGLSVISSQMTAPGTWRAFAVTIGYPGGAMVHMFISFPVPYRYALVNALVLLPAYLSKLLPHQRRALQLLQLGRYAERACLASPMAALLTWPKIQQLCGNEAGHMLVLVYIFVLLGMLLPLQLLYWQEKSAKQAYLHSCGVHVEPGEGLMTTKLAVTLWAIAVALLASY
jgi:hypothetical protein